MMCLERLNSTVRKLGWVAALLALQFVWTASAFATCGDHLQAHGDSMLAHAQSESESTHQPSDAPRPQLPCHGLSCSKGTPLVPTPFPVKVQVEDQHCWLSLAEVAAWSARFEKRMCDDGFRLPERRAGRLDRPPRVA
ncbi:MAG: hypothetical protein ACKV2Q_35775 [Planctomycetaceae bacterium]